jgi:hypothetical protein
MGVSDEGANRFPHLVMAGLVPAIVLGLDPRIERLQPFTTRSSGQARG